MEFRVLGPVEDSCNGRPLQLGGARQRAVLSAMLVDANRVVSVERLINAVWDERPPSTARHQIRTSVSGLRKMFADLGAEREVIVTKPPGYSLVVKPGELDSQEFEAKAFAARNAAAEGDLAAAVTAARSALALWRSPAWDGIAGQIVQAEATRLEQWRLGLLENCLDWELALGKHHEVIGELITLASDHPLRERFHYQLMLALYRDGRQAQALEAYQRARAAFQQELGLDPSEELQQLQHSILAHDPSLTEIPNQPAGREQILVAAPATTYVPLQLPRDIDDFTGRAEQLNRITTVLGSVDSESRSVPLVVITGPGGVGKSTLAIRAAHQLAERFTDGQLYVDLHGSQNHPAAEPAELLARFLRAMGVPGSAIPETLDERAEMYRSHLGGSRRLVVLDNAADESQIRPLLPGSPGCAVLVTSRARLTGIAGTELVELDVLDTDCAVALLTTIAASRDARPDPEAAARIADLCGHLPLALRIVGAKLAARPHRTAARLAERLHDEQRRLDELSHGDMSVRASIDLSYSALDPRTQSLFRRLALLDTPDLPSWAAAAVLDTTVAEADDLLDHLADAQLVQVSAPDGAKQIRFSFHDLVQVYAKERANADESAEERRAAIERAAGAWLGLARRAHGKIYGGDYQIVAGDAKDWLPTDLPTDAVLQNALEWLDAERLALVALVRQTADAGMAEFCWNLAVTSATLFENRAYHDDWWNTHQWALSATRAAGNRRGEAAILNWLGELRLAQGRLVEAKDYCGRARSAFEEIGDDYGKALAQVRVAHVRRLFGEYQQALEEYETALPTIRTADDLSMEAYVLRSIGQIELSLKRTNAAQRTLDTALRIARSIGSCRDSAQVLFQIGNLQLQRQQLTDALRTFEQVLSMTSDLGDYRGRTAALYGLGSTYVARHEHDQARPLLRKALEGTRELRDRTFEAGVLVQLGLVDAAVGNHASAIEQLNRARTISREMEMPNGEAVALTHLAEVHEAAGNDTAALVYLTEAERLFRSIGSPRADEIARQIDSLTSVST